MRRVRQARVQHEFYLGNRVLSEPRKGFWRAGEYADESSSSYIVPRTKEYHKPYQVVLAQTGYIVTSRQKGNKWGKKDSDDVEQTSLHEPARMRESEGIYFWWCLHHVAWGERVES